MRQIAGYDLVTEAGETKKLPAGIYKLKITKVNDISDRDYLEVHFDIVDGEFKGYFSTLQNVLGKDYGVSMRSYKEKALPFFKAFITAVEKTNSGYTWNWDEHTLENKYVVGVFGEEEYIDVNNELKVNVKLQEFHSAEALRDGKLSVPPLKKLPEEQVRLAKPVSSVAQVIDDSDLPF